MLLALVIGFFIVPSAAISSEAPTIEFDHTHSYTEIAAYMRAVAQAFPKITKLHNIGKSYEKRDLLVMEISNQSTGNSLEKPGYFIDGNVHPAEAAGAEMSANTIQTLVTKYGKEPYVTRLVDSSVFYIMPIMNPDGVELYITTPDGTRGSTRPFDEDRDGLVNEDPPEDLDGDKYITLMRVRDSHGAFKTSSEDPRLMVPREQGTSEGEWKGEWTVYTEGVDNDHDGRFNEDGVGGLDLNRNWPEQWQPYPVEYNPGPYALSEPETKALAEFLLSRPNLIGLINYHGTGNVIAYPPSNLRFDPLTGDRRDQSYQDESTYKKFGEEARMLFSRPGELAPYVVKKIYGATVANANQSVFGMEVDWAYYRLGVFSWILEAGVVPGAKGAFPSNILGQELERLRWSDAHMGGKLFVKWQRYSHPQLGEVEIGGFVDKVYDPKYGTYTSTRLLPGPECERLLAAHTKWHLWLVDQAPRVRIVDTKVTPLGPGHFKIDASVQNQGFLPTYVTKQALISESAKVVKATLSLTGATLVSGIAEVDLGHLPGNPPPGRSAFTQHAGEISPVKHVQWLVTVADGEATAIVKAVSEKGGTDSKEVKLTRN